MDETAAARLAASLRTAMKDQALSGADLADRIGRLTGSTPSPVWVSRRTGVGARKRLIEVDPDLFLIARALEIGRSDLIELVIRAVFGEPEVDQPIPYELTDKPVPAEPGRHDTSAEHDRHFGRGELSDDCAHCTTLVD